MDPFRVNPFTTGQLEQRANDMAADFGSIGNTGNLEVISAAGYFYIESAFDLSQVLIELSAKIGETSIVGGFQDDFPGYLYGVQG